MTKKPATEKTKKEAVPMGQRLFGFCVAVLGAAIALSLAVELIKAIWVWLLVGAVVVVAGWVVAAWWRRRQDRW